MRARSLIRANHPLCVVLLIQGAVALAGAPEEPGQQEIENRFLKVQEQIRRANKQLEQHRGELGELEKQLREAEQGIGELSQQSDATAVRLNQGQANMAALQREKQQLQDEWSAQQRILYVQIRLEYQIGRQQKLKLLLQQEHPETLARDLTYYEYLHRARWHEMEKAARTMQSMNQVRMKIQQAEQELQAVQTRLMDEKACLLKAQKQRKLAMSALNKQVLSEQENLAVLEGDAKRLQGLIEKLHATLTNIPAIDQQEGFEQSQGKLYWPVMGPPSNTFGQKRNAARSNLKWQGVFIPGHEGDNVRSIYRGRVAFAEWMRGLGLLVIIDHGGGYMSLYGHNQRLSKQVGEWVKAGEILATVGNSGGNGRTGLYFEIRKQGNPVDPANWCAKSASSEELSVN